MVTKERIANCVSRRDYLVVNCTGLMLLSIMMLTTSSCGRKTVPPPDKIDQLVVEQSSNGFFSFGMYIPIRLPENELPQQVAAAALREPITNLMFLEIKRVKISSGFPFQGGYWAVLLDDRSVQKIILMQYMTNANQIGWWTHVYDAK